MKLTRFTTNRSLEDGVKLAEQRLKDSLYIFNKYEKDFVWRECPVCGASDAAPYDTFHGTYAIVRCQRCATLFVNPSPAEKALDDYYGTCACNRLSTQIIEKRKKAPSAAYINDARLRALVELAKEIGRSPVDILEVGAGPGVFLDKVREVLAEGEATLTGIDLNPEAVAYGKEKGHHIICANIEDYLRNHSQSYDVIMHFELLEHLLNPKRFLEACRHLLRPGGFLLFTCPNVDGLDNMAVGFNADNRLMAHGIYPPMHLTGLSLRNIYYLLLTTGYAVTSISTPGKLDVDIVNIHSSQLKKEPYTSIATMSEENQAILQETVASLNASSHMLVVAKKIKE